MCSPQRTPRLGVGSLTVVLLLLSGASGCESIVEDVTTQTVQGRVVDAETGAPVEGARVEVGDYRKTFGNIACNIIKPPCSEQSFITEAQTFSRADGSFAFDRVSRSATHVLVMPPPPPDPHRPVFFGTVVEIDELDDEIQLHRQGGQH